ncbi:hypothetical protein MF410_15060 [Rhizobium sp. C104]|uniref:hypothetical protein n=1 Tax=Rhizobium sp. C104 TaxID=2917727 RepID=UPI001EF77FA8|nr:hypothetical protein [Rhizobium sp. C104]ULJ77364.1 hypothetical protein MF410_15060 [Rhizobium sp. C104]
MARSPEKTSEKLSKLEKILLDMDVASGQEKTQNAIVNIAALLAFQDKIEEAMGESVGPADYFAVLANRVMQGGAIVLTDESTTGQVVEVEFSKKIRF